MGVSVRREGIARLVATDIAGFLIRLAVQCETYSKINAPKDSGELAASIARDPAQITAQDVRIRVGTHCGYGLFPEKGTGIYGPTGRPIVPKTAMGLLAFKPRGSSHIIRVRSVRGQPGQHFMAKSLAETVVTI